MWVNFMGFKEDIQKLKIDIIERKPHISNEEQTKQSLIIPFINSLGYDTSNPLEVKAEFVSDYGKKAGTRVDYAILKDNKPIIFIEAKPVNTILSNYDSQLEFYFNSSTNDVKLGILTNGEEYRFFTDLKKSNKMDEKPFIILSFADLKETDLVFLECLKKDSYATDRLSEYAEMLAYASSFREILKDLFTSPNDEFVRLLIKNTNPDVVVTTKLIERFRPIIKKSIYTTIADMVSNGLVQQMLPRKNPEENSTELESQTKDNSQDLPEEKTENEKSQNETTDEELTALSLIKTILEKNGKDITDVKGVDTVNYYSINNRLSSKWFIRFVLREEKKVMAVRMSPEKANALLKGFTIDIAPSHLGGGAKIIFKSVRDLFKMQELISYCFDEVNQT
jgi:hypothetical protein